MRKTFFPGSLALLIGGVLCNQAASAQTCGNNAMLNGSYVYMAIQTGFIGVAVTPPGTAGTSGATTIPTGGTTPTGTTGATGTTYSSTGVGQLLAGLTGSVPFSSSGSLTFDGAGNVFASSSPAGGGSTIVGTYTVNPNCTITVTLRDAFGSNTSPAETLQGIVVGNGAEVDLGVEPATATTTTGTSGSGSSGSSSTGSSSTLPIGEQSQSGLLIRLIRSFSSGGCSNGNLMGPYALVLNGLFAQSSTPTSGSSGTGSAAQATQPFSLITLVYFNGGGNIIANPASAQTVSLQSVGTYTVNADCSGTMTLTSAPSSSTSTATSTGTSGSASTSGAASGAGPASTASSTKFTVSFVLTAPTVTVSLGNLNLSTYPLNPGLILGVSNTNETASGFGTFQ